MTRIQAEMARNRKTFLTELLWLLLIAAFVLVAMAFYNAHKTEKVLEQTARLSEEMHRTVQEVKTRSSASQENTERVYQALAQIDQNLAELRFLLDRPSLGGKPTPKQ